MVDKERHKPKDRKYWKPRIRRHPPRPPHNPNPLGRWDPKGDTQEETLTEEKKEYYRELVREKVQEKKEQLQHEIKNAYALIAAERGGVGVFVEDSNSLLELYNTLNNYFSEHGTLVEIEPKDLDIEDLEKRIGGVNVAERPKQISIIGQVDDFEYSLHLEPVIWGDLFGGYAGWQIINLKPIESILNKSGGSSDAFIAPINVTEAERPRYR